METEQEKLEQAGVWEQMSPDTQEMLTALSESQKTEGEDFTVYREGLFSASVCSSLPQSEVLERMAARPCGTTAGWMLSDNPTFSGGEPNPCPCDQNPATHRHYLFDA